MKHCANTTINPIPVEMLDFVKSFLGIATTNRDDYITLLIEANISLLECELGIAILLNTYECTYNINTKFSNQIEYNCGCWYLKLPIKTPFVVFASALVNDVSIDVADIKVCNNRCLIPIDFCCDCLCVMLQYDAGYSEYALIPKDLLMLIAMMVQVDYDCCVCDSQILKMNNIKNKYSNKDIVL